MPEASLAPAAGLAAPRGRIAAIAILAGLALLAVAVGPLVLDTYTMNIMVRSFTYAAAALTVDLLWGYTGVLTFGQSALFGIGGYAAGLVFTHLGFSPGLALLALAGGMAAAAVLAAFVGWISFHHGASPLYVAIVTLALPIVVVQLLYSGGTFTGSSSGLVGFFTFDLSVEDWFRIAGTGLVLATVAAWFFVTSDYGRVLVAIRENETRATYLGIDTARIKIVLMAVCGLVAAAAGFAYANFTMVVAPEIAGFVFGTELVIWVALGGRGTLIGPVLGTIGIDVVSAYLSGELPFVWKLIVGVVFVAVIVVLPQGLFPVLFSGLRRLAALAGIGRGSAGRARPAPRLTAAATGVRTGDASSAAALRVEGLGRSYGSLKVLDGVSFSAAGSEILGIVGPNGAGKTTLMRCLSDGTERTGGSVHVYGEETGRRPPQGIVALGIGRSFQTTSLFETLTVAECLRLARHRLNPPKRFARSDALDLPESSLRVVLATGLDEVLSVEARHLSHGRKRALELAMVLALEPGVLLLDEPTAGLTKAERTMIGSVLVDLARRDALCILLIEHDLDFVREVSTRILVLHQGAIVMDGTVAEVVGSDLVRQIYAGHGAPPAGEARPA